MRLRQFVALAAGMLVGFVNGSIYIFGTMTPYIVTLLRYHGDQSVTISDLSIIPSASLCAINFGIFLANLPVLRFSNRVTCLISAFGVGICSLVISFLDQFIYYVLVFGVLNGVFVGFAYMAPIKNCYEHLPHRKGLCSGCCLTGFGLGSFIFNFILVALVNPNNEKQDEDNLFPKDVGDNLPFALQILAAVYGAIGIIAFVLIKPPPVETQLDADLIEKQKMESELEQPHYSFFALRLSCVRRLWLLALILTFSLPFGLFVAFHYKEFGLIYINDDIYQSIVGSIGSVANGLFRLLCGVLMDCFSYRVNSIVMILVLGACCAVMPWAVRNRITYPITVLLAQGTYGGLYSVYPTQTIRVLGKPIGSKLYYITFLGFSFGSMIQYFAHKFLVEEYGDDGYIYCFYLFGGMLVVALVLVLTIKFQDREERKAAEEAQGKQSKQESFFDLAAA